MTKEVGSREFGDRRKDKEAAIVNSHSSFVNSHQPIKKGHIPASLFLPYRVK